MRSKSFTISDFYCPKCGMKIPLPRKPGNKRKRGHQKWLYCPKCKCRLDFTEVRSNDFYVNGLGEKI